MPSFTVQCSKHCVCQMTDALTKDEAWFLRRLHQEMFEDPRFPNGVCKLVRKFAKKPDITHRRLAHLLSRPLASNNCHWGKDSFLRRVAGCTLCDLVYRLPLCPHVAAKQLSTGPFLAIHDACSFWQESRKGYLEWVLNLGAYPLCGCQDVWCRPRDASCAHLVPQWHRWGARWQRRRWLLTCPAARPQCSC